LAKHTNTRVTQGILKERKMESLGGGLKEGKVEEAHEKIMKNDGM